MIQLTDADIELNARAHTKEEAIRLAGGVLVRGGYVEPDYVDSMIGREQEANTYLGNGIAIPHGMYQSRELIKRTGISVVQLPQGVEWSPGDTVYLMVGIAARGDEHLGILANLSDVLDDPDTAQRLAHTTNPADIISVLGSSRAEDGQEAQAEPEPASIPTIDVQIRGKAGLHARPAALFVQTAKQFKSDITVLHNGKTANAKALVSLLKLGVSGGSTIRIQAEGADAQAALQALREAVESGLGEAEETHQAADVYTWTPVSGGRAIAGIAASPGLAIGPLYHLKHSHIVVTDNPQDVATEKQLFAQALAAGREHLQDLYASVRERAGSAEAAIFEAHQAFLADPELINDVHGQIERGHSAAWAWNSAIETRVAEVEQVQDERLRARAADLQDVGRHVLRELAPTDTVEPALPTTPVIIVADDLTPSDTAKLDPKRTLALCTVAGGPTSHTAIIARSLDIPAIVGIGPTVLEQADGTVCIVDGSVGKVYLEPNDADLQSARQAQIEIQGQRDQEYAARNQPAEMTDGARIEVVANIGKAADAAEAVAAGAEGVGLLRTEFLFLGRDTPPTEDEQFAAYSEMARALNGMPLIIRTLDIGGDKAVPYLNLPHEDNPFLGERGIRLCLRKPELFMPQLRAIYRASQVGPLMIMFPMIATLEELRQAKAVAEQVCQELGAAPVPIGIMVEVPSTVMMAREFAKEVDFFSVGTNDLTQYTLAMDRLHPTLAKQADALHPAVLRMIEQVVHAADAAGKWVGVCGGMAGEPRGAIILAGLGVKELSMSIPSVAAVKAKFRQISSGQAKQVAQRAVQCTTADEVRQLPLP